MQPVVYRAPFAPGGSHAIDANIAQQLIDLALERGGDYADLYFEYALGGSYGYEDQRLRTASRGLSLGLGVRVLHGESTGYAYTEDLSIEAMKKAARTAAQIAQSGSAHQPLAIQGLDIPQRYAALQLAIDEEGATKKALLQRADTTARKSSPLVTQVQASLAESYREILIVNSEGVMVFDRQPMLRFGINVVVERNDERQSGNSGGGGRVGMEYFAMKTPEWHAQEAVRHALAMLDAREMNAGEFPVVLSPGDSGILLHEAVGHGLEADFNRKKTSNYSDSVGQQVASTLCTVIDDATLDGSRGAINVDDEGNVPNSVTLIENGVLRGYMQDHCSARFLNTRPTGNGRRESFRSHPMPRMTNTLLAAGEDDPEEIVRSVEYGIYARKFGGGQVDISNGDFVFSITEGYLIEDGKISAPVKGVNLIGNGPDAMRKVVMLGNDLQFSDGVWTCGKEGQSVPVGVGCPTIKISSMTVGGTKL